MDDLSKQELKTITIQLNPKDIFKTKNIDNLINFTLKSKLENVCGKYGYVLPDSVNIIKRSIGKLVIHDGVSMIQYNLTYKMNTIYPNKGDVYDAVINNITKMGIISYSTSHETDDIKDSPLLIITPHPYIEDISIYKPGMKIKIEVLDKRIKYRSKQIQVVGKIVK